MTKKPRIGVILGTTRPTRWGGKPAAWIRDRINADGRMEAEVLDLATFDLPFFEEVASSHWVPSQSPAAVAWQTALSGFDGFVFVTAEYNHSISGVLKNALDHAFDEWARKPAAIVGYGGLGAARAAQHLREIAVELRMVNVMPGVHLAGSELMKIHPAAGGEGEVADIEYAIAESADKMIEELHWWSVLLRDARQAEAAKAA